MSRTSIARDNLEHAIRMLAQASRMDALKGSRAPDEVPGIEADLRKARGAVSTRISLLIEAVHEDARPPS